ncbi:MULTISPECIES: hypothetical protein [Micromonospora]|uniref:hypothetical protein n=1 Tax=Micromonospora TaxID=1873 RepID=UPI00115FBB44|nr:MULTISPECIES: hypothetical protein [Micromonospora]
MDLLISAASSLQEVKISERRPLDTAGDGLAFPLDAGLALQALEVAGAVAGSVEAMRLLLEAWRKVRSKRSGDSADTSSQIFICNLRTGEVMYSGDQLDAAVIDAVLSKVEKGSRD